jgi:hypothetical protein
MNNPYLVAAFAVVLTAIIAFLVRIDSRLQDHDQKLAILGTQVSPLWAKIQKQIAGDLHQPHPRYFEMDDLLEKLEKLTITTGERRRLKVLLVERSHDMHPDITEAQRQKAELMIKVMDIVVQEAEDGAD